MKQYDYIIAGAGAAGMSLLYRMMKHDFFNEKKILVVDKAPKNTNDHTWCFWEKQPDVFESIVHHEWQNVHFYSNDFSGLLYLSPYRYKMLRSIDLYSFVMDEASRHPNISFQYGVVTEMRNEGQNALLKIDGDFFSAQFIFNSILFDKIQVPKGKHSLLQHFKGWVIETEEPVFKSGEATLMDFRVSQQHGTTFMYVLPTADNKALVEYTLFTEKLLAEESYTNALKDYIQSIIKVNHYKVIEEEFGIIPMTNTSFTKQNRNIINTGTAGGQTKPSTGYTFKFIQKQCDQILDAIVHNRPFYNNNFSHKKFLWYDSILLNVLAKKRMPGDKIFAKIFEKNKASSVFRFLDNESELGEDLRIINSLPKMPFLIAALEEMMV